MRLRTYVYDDNDRPIGGFEIRLSAFQDSMWDFLQRQMKFQFFHLLKKEAGKGAPEKSQPRNPNR